METGSKWFFTKEQIANSPSRKHMAYEKEMKYRQQCASFIQELGQSLRLTQLCINTAIVYMHRFFMVHSMIKFDVYKIGTAAVFLSSKAEESPRKMEHVIHVSYRFLYKRSGPLVTMSDRYSELANELVFNENVLLMTLGFDVMVQHPHTSVLTCCKLIKADKDLQATSYFMASNSLHLSTMCLQYRPTVVACFCIHLTSKWTSYDIPLSKQGKPWFWYVDKEVTVELLEQLTKEFLHVFDKCQTKLKRVSQSVLDKNKNSQHQNQTSKSRLTNKQHPIPNQESSHHHHNPQLKIAQVPQKPPHQNETRLVQRQNLIPVPPSKPRSIFSPENTDTGIEFEKCHDRMQSQQQMTRLCEVPKPLAFNLPTNLHPLPNLSDLPQNLLKRRASDDQNLSAKRLCVYDQSVKIMNEIVSILKSATSPESKPIMGIPSVNCHLIAKSIDPEPSTIQQNSLCPLVNVSENRLTSEVIPGQEFPKLKEDIWNPQDFSKYLPPKIKEEVWNSQDFSKTLLQDNKNRFEFPKNATPENSSMIDTEFLKVEKTLTFSLTEVPPIEEKFLSLKNVLENVPETCRSEIKESPNVDPVEETKNKDCEKIKSKHKHKSKKSKKEKKEKRRAKKEKRKGETKKEEKYCDKKEKKGENAPIMPIKISIPKKKLNLTSDLVFTSGSNQRSSQNTILKMKIPKEPAHDIESDSPSSVESFQASLNFKIQIDRKTDEMPWLAQCLQPVSGRY